MGRAKRKPRVDTKDGEEPDMYRLQLIKTTTEFFSERGNNLLKRIWLEKNLDEEMIFSSWIGPSEALIRQKVADYLQAFLLGRLRHVPFHENETLSFLQRFSAHCDLAFNADDNGRLDYFNEYIRTTLKRRCREREMAEKLRVEKSIAKNDLPVLPGYEYVSQHSIYRAEQLEKRIKYLSKIPIPYNQADFEKHILPMKTSYAIAKEKKHFNILSNVKKDMDRSSKEITSEDFTVHADDSGVTLKGSHSSDTKCSTDASDSDSELIQIFSEMELNSRDLKNILDNTFDDEVCEVCGGFNNDNFGGGPLCTCMSDSIWNGSCPVSASSLYTDALKILNLHAKQHSFSKKFMKEEVYTKLRKK